MFPDDANSGALFCDLWWPTVADRCFQRLANRPQGLPEDPLAHGILSFIEYELARRPPSAQEPTVDATAETSMPDGGSVELAENAPAEPAAAQVRDYVASQSDGPTPLPKDVQWQWLLRSHGEIVGPKGGRD